MNQERHSNDGECLSPETVMAFLDQEIEQNEAAAVQAHLEACARCRRIAEELVTASKAVAIHLTCLDDESMAAYVDHQMGRMRGPVSEAEIQRTRDHLDRCERCREEVEILAQACETRVGALDRLQRLLGGGGWTERPAARPALRWAALAAIVVAGVLAFLGLRGRGPVPPTGSRVVEAPIAPSSEPGATTDIAERPVPGSGVGEEAPSEVRLPDAEPVVEPPSAAGPPSPQPELPTETALMAELADAKGELAAALSALAEATKSGDAAAEAGAAFEVAGIYHGGRDYDSASRYYRGAIAAAERADEVELRIDSMILLGAALAEMGETEEARQHFDLALEMAREVGYDRGETNALVQLRVLEGKSTQGQH
jgi:tetratricopeptide (TPR) repeat protein